MYMFNVINSSDAVIGAFGSFGKFGVCGAFGVFGAAVTTLEIVNISVAWKITLQMMISPAVTVTLAEQFQGCGCDQSTLTH